MKPRRHPCPICKTPVEWNEQARYRPFCSERCRLIDLGEWFGEARGIPGEPAAIPEQEAGDGDSFPWKGSD